MKLKGLIGFQVFFFIIYFISMVPLENLGLSSTITERLRIPAFITGEISKTLTGTLLYFVLIFTIFYINYRLIFTLPRTILKDEPLSKSIKESWKATKKKMPQILIPIGIFEIIFMFAGLLLMLIVAGILGIFKPFMGFLLSKTILQTMFDVVFFAFSVFTKISIVIILLDNIEPQKSTEEIERENRLRQLESEADAAFRSPTTITIATRPQTQQVDNKVLLAQNGNKPVEDYDGNRQESKKNFLMNEQAQKFYQTNFLVEQLSEFELKAGDFIPATLQTGINSDLPSKVIVAVVSENVRDTISGKHILIPQGTRVVGTYDSSVTFGQERLLVVWQRLIFPDGKSIGLDNMQGVDLSGKAGITGEIDNHFGTLLKGVVLSSIMGSAGAIVTDRKNDWRGAAAEGAGEQIVTIGDRFAERALSRQPTINIEPGTRLNIMVHSDLILEPYGE